MNLIIHADYLMDAGVLKVSQMNSELIVKTPYCGTFCPENGKITPREKLIKENGSVIISL